MPNKDMIKARKQFVGANRGSGKSDVQLRRKFFVKTRLEEMRSAGKTVDAGTRKRLVERYKSGNVKRAEFYAGGEKERAKRRSAGETKPAAAPSRPSYKPTGTTEATAKATGGTLVKGSKAGAAGARIAEGRKYGSPEIAASKKKSMQSQNPSSRNRRTAYGSPESALSAAAARKAAAAKKSSKAK